MNETEDTNSYAPPVAKLLTYGSVQDLPMDQPHWPNYLELGIESAHIPDLVRLIADKTLRAKDIDDSDPIVWAAVHAWRALGQLKDVAAVEPLLALYQELLDDDTGYGEWAIEELPEVFALIGPGAIPQLTHYLADTSQAEDSRINASTSLQRIGQAHPESREEIVSILTQQLERFDEEDETINAYVISALSALDAKDTLPLIERAFAAKKVDEFVINLDYVLVRFGLKEREAPSFTIENFLSALQQAGDSSLASMPAGDIPLLDDYSPTGQESFPTARPAPLGISFSKKKAPTKAKNKMAKASRKKNRRKK